MDQEPDPKGIVAAETVYESVCANRHENNISCHKDYLLYSRSNCPVIYHLPTKQVATLLLGHTDEVNGQRFVARSDEQATTSKDAQVFHLISTSHDKTAIIWELSPSCKTAATGQQQQLGRKLLYKIESPDNDVFISRCSICENSQFKSVLTTIGGSIYLWTNDKLEETLTTEYYCFDSRIHTIQVDPAGPRYNFVFLAGSDNKIHVFQLLDSSLKHLFNLTGHSDWIKCMDILNLPGKHLEFLVASASQDSFIRVWHMKLVDYEIDSSQVRTTVSQPLFNDPSNESSHHKLTATLETVLSGHEGIVYGLCWFKKQPELILQLVSCSADKTIVIWRSSMALVDPDKVDIGQGQQLNRYDQCPASGEIWKETQRLGETGETNLPFLGLCLSEDESILYSHSLRGAIHSWTRDNDSTDKWIPYETIKGHFEPVTDLSWERSGSYLISSSLDKTCRLHALAAIDDRWHEIARPQVHGHEINCLVSLSFAKFASGAEEKTIRTFGATQFFMKNFNALAKAQVPEEIELDQDDIPVHAQLPALGLSNRGAQSPYDIEEQDDNGKSGAGGASDEWYTRSKLVEELAQIEHLDKLPIEEVLLQSTLWWETNKLFGHGNELYALAVNSTGSYLASASKANRPDLASVIVWECAKFRKAATLEHHGLTVTRLRFSPDDKYLLSVSRDRTWCLSVRTGKPRAAYRKLIGTTKSNAIHDRIIWDCSWTHDSKYFITVSRDRKGIIWSMEELEKSCASCVADDCGDGGATVSVTPSCVASSELFERSIQAVDSPADGITSLGYLFALGFEDGSLELHAVQVLGPALGEWQKLKCFSHFHHLPIRRLAFRPPTEGAGEESCGDHKTKRLLLASAGDDCIVKLTRFALAE